MYRLVPEMCQDVWVFIRAFVFLRCPGPYLLYASSPPPLGRRKEHARALKTPGIRPRGHRHFVLDSPHAGGRVFERGERRRGLLDVVRLWRPGLPADFGNEIKIRKGGYSSIYRFPSTSFSNLCFFYSCEVRLCLHFLCISYRTIYLRLPPFTLPLLFDNAGAYSRPLSVHDVLVRYRSPRCRCFGRARVLCP